MSALSWLIVGGGVHGVHIATRLIGDGGVTSEQIRILDPANTLLARWRSCTSTTGMRYLRSPAVHHLDRDPFSLYRFASKQMRPEFRPFTPPYNRPSLAMFNAHCDGVIEEHNLRTLHLRAWALDCQIDCDGVSVTTNTGKELRAKRVVLAIGASEQPAWPSWAPTDDPRVAHIFARGFSLPSKERQERIAVIGGGISAAQTALRVSGDGHEVHLISRHSLREHQFDSDSGWLGPKFLTRFERETDMSGRRAMITKARHRGSIPRDIHYALREAIDVGKIRWVKNRVDSISDECDALKLYLSKGDELLVDRILLATGFSPDRPGGAMLDRLIRTASLPCAQCGYPIVDSALRWHSQIHVSGPLAELELGPASRNIAGARQAADRIISALKFDAKGRRRRRKHTPLEHRTG